MKIIAKLPVVVLSIFVTFDVVAVRAQTPKRQESTAVLPSDFGPPPVFDPLLAPNRSPGASNARENARTTETLPKGVTQSPAVPVLLQARRALARNEFRLAEQLVERAKDAGRPPVLRGDSPSRVESLIRRYKAIKSGPSSAPERQGRDLADCLMEQADWLLRYRDFGLAEYTAQQAQQVPVKYEAFERTPAKLLVEISRAKSSTGEGGVASNEKAKALKWMSEAQYALQRGEIQMAQSRIQSVLDLRIPDEAFGPNEPRPWELKLKIDRAASRRPDGVAQASFQTSGDAKAARIPVGQRPDNTRNATAQYDASLAQNTEIGQPPSFSPDRRGLQNIQQPQGRQLYDQGMRALEKRDAQSALRLFKEAWKYKEQLDPQTQQRLQDKLVSLQAITAEPPPPARPKSPLEQLDDRQKAALDLVRQNVFRERYKATEMTKRDPRGALERLHQLRSNVVAAQIDSQNRKHLLNIVDRSIRDVEQYIEANKVDIETNEINAARMADVEARRQNRIDVENKLAGLVDQFNELIDEQRFAEAEVIARQARELDPKNPVVETLIWKSRFVKRIGIVMADRDRAEEGFWKTLQNVEKSKIPFDDEFPYQFADTDNWKKLSLSRFERQREYQNRLSHEDIKIKRALRETKVNVQFEDRPLSEVLDVFAEIAGINIHADPRGLIAEGRTTDEPVKLKLNQPISLRSALNIILEPLGLGYVIQNEVVKVTSKQLRDENVYTETYYVADLVIPIPNFVPSYNIGLPSAIAAAHNAIGKGAIAPAGNNMPLSVGLNQDYTNPVTNNPQALANVMDNGSMMGTARSTQPMGYGPGGLGGGAAADFDSLIELITSTVVPESWDEVGGPGTIDSFDANLALIVSQTQEVHEEIEELLTQLRRLQDLQVTIEVRFITLNDNWFERIGVDFDFNINDNTVFNENNPPPEDFAPRTIIGQLGNGVLTADGDIPFTQESFGASVPIFGGFDAGAATTVGFAILSDIEVFFLLQASTGDSRTNVLQAPKVTLFNGQTAIVSDTSQRPFVTSVVPVVGDFAAAQQPVIVVLSEGTQLSVQAVVSNDKRFVRLTLVPFFSTIGDVQEFTFTGKKVTQSNSPQINPLTGELNGETDTTSEITEGTTVQLPTFAFTTVNTTVSVPDGGTVLLGGIKRLNEGRAERGLPLISKMPYINRLFKNVGIGRQTQSLMMMVTPRIIIQEEEEIEQTGLDPSKL